MPLSQIIAGGAETDAEQPVEHLAGELRGVPDVSNSRLGTSGNASDCVAGDGGFGMACSALAISVVNKIIALAGRPMDRAKELDRSAECMQLGPFEPRHEALL